MIFGNSSAARVNEQQTNTEYREQFLFGYASNFEIVSLERVFTLASSNPIDYFDVRVCSEKKTE